MRNILEDVMSITIPKTSEALVNNELKAFINQIVKGDIYLYIGNNFSTDFLELITFKNCFKDKIFDKNKNYKILKEFITLRDFSKKAMLEYLYCSTKSKEKRYLEIRRIFPKVVNDFVDEMKALDKRDFPIILQNIEAHLFLDVITKKIALENPYLFIATIHDSVVVPEENEEQVKLTMADELYKTFGIMPEIKSECWCEPLRIAS